MSLFFLLNPKTGNLDIGGWYTYNEEDPKPKTRPKRKKRLTLEEKNLIRYFENKDEEELLFLLLNLMDYDD